MIVLTGADLVLPDRVLAEGSLVLADGRIVAIEPRRIEAPAGADSTTTPAVSRGGNRRSSR